MTKKRFFSTYVLIMMLISSLTSLVYAQQTNSLTPLLINLKGWTSEPAQGMNMDMNGMKMINAVREYHRGNADVTATIMIGNSMMTQGQMQQVNAETSKARMTTRKINGFNVYTHYDKPSRSGSVLIFIGKAATDQSIFIISYEGLTEKEGLEFAKKFSWDEIQKGTQKRL